MTSRRSKREAKSALWLETDDLGKQLAGRSARGGVFTTVSYGYEFAARTLCLFYLARILSPDDVGLVGLVTLVSVFFMMFADLGLSAATIQAKSITQGQASNLFWISALLGLGFTVLTVLIAPLVAWFFAEPRITMLLYVSAAGFFACGLGFQHRALMQRRMRFGLYCSVNLVAVTTGLVVAITLARQGWGAYSLVIQNLVIYTVGTVMAWLLCSWRPDLPDRESDVGTMLRFGGAMFGSGLLNFLGRQLDKLILGRMWGTEALGLYQYAYRIGTLPGALISEALGRVAVPGMSRLQDEPERYRNYFRRILEIVTFLMVPGAFMLFFFAEELVYLALGEKWDEAAPLVRAFSGVALFNALQTPMLWIYTSLGRGKRLLIWLSGACSALLIFFLVGAQFGVEAFVWSYSLAMALLTIPCLLFSTAGSPIGMLDSTADFMRACVGSLIGIGGVAWLGDAGMLAGGADRFWSAVIIPVAGGLGYLLVMSICFRSHRVFHRLYLLLRKRNPAAIVTS